jgi:hypothetical protein
MAPDLRALVSALGQLYEAKVTDEQGRIRVEDLLSAGAAVCGEACLAAAGEVDPTEHDLTPGSPVLSSKVNEILCSDVTDWDEVEESVFGVVRSGALAHGYLADDFPPIEDMMLGFVKGVAGGMPVEWGFVPLSVADGHRPFVQPLRQAFELREPVRRALIAESLSPGAWPAACALALVVELTRVREAIDRRVAITLVLETVTGMAKTAPMTDRHMRQAANRPN